MIRPNLVPLALFPWLMAIVRGQTVAEARRADRAVRGGQRPGRRWPSRGSTTSLRIAVDVRLRRSRPGVLARLTRPQRPPVSGVVAGEPGAVRHSCSWCRSGVGAVRRCAKLLVLIGFAVTVALLYLFYLPFDAWWFLRFVLPAVPIAAAALRRPVALGRRLTRTTVRVAHWPRFTRRRRRARVAVHRHPRPARHRPGERALPGAALHIAPRTPPDAVILAMQHSGSVRYYTGRLIVRWDALESRPGSIARSRSCASGDRDLRCWSSTGRRAEFRQPLRGQQRSPSWIAARSRPRARGTSGSIRCSAPESRAARAGRHRSASRHRTCHRHLAGLSRRRA